MDPSTGRVEDASSQGTAWGEGTPPHVVQNKVEAAYAGSELSRGPRRLMDDWMHYLNGRRQ